MHYWYADMWLSQKDFPNCPLMDEKISHPKDQQYCTANGIRIYNIYMFSNSKSNFRLNASLQPISSNWCMTRCSTIPWGDGLGSSACSAQWWVTTHQGQPNSKRTFQASRILYYLQEKVLDSISPSLSKLECQTSNFRFKPGGNINVQLSGSKKAIFSMESE